jgi:hypothetical protein
MTNRASMSPIPQEDEARRRCPGRKGETGKVGERSRIIYSSSNSHRAMLGMAAGMTATLLVLACIPSGLQA